MAFSADFITWLGAPARRCLIAEVGVKSGSEITRYLSTTGYTSEPGDTPASQLYNGRISGGVDFTRRLALDGSGGSMAFGDIELDNEDGALDDWLNDIWAGRAINIYLGQPDWPKSDFELVFSGTIEDVAVKSRSRLSLKVRDIFGPLNSTLSTATVGGTADNKDALRPICLGECFNVAPVLLDAATQKYGVHLDSAIEDVLEVRDNGISVAFTDTVANGNFVLTNARYGQITADVQGAKVGGAWRNDAGGLVEWVALASVGDGNGITSGQIDAGALTTFRAANAQPVGLWLPDRANRLQVMQQLAAAVGATVTTTYDGKLILAKIAFGTPAGAVGTRQMVDGSFGPIGRTVTRGAIRMAGERNWTPQAAGQLAGSVAAAPLNLPILGDEWVYIDDSDATTLADWNQTEAPNATETLMVVESDITDEAARLLALWMTPHTIFGFDGFPETLQYEIGDTITLTHPRFGLSGGVSALIVGVLHDWITPRVRFEVMV